MPRPRRDGQAPRSANKRKLNELFIQKVKPQDRGFLVWDTEQKKLALCVQPSGHAAFKCIYPFHGRSRWYHIGDAKAIGLKTARDIARKVMNEVAEGKDPQADRKAHRSRGTFEALAARYVEEYAKKNNKSWAQADKLVRRYAVPLVGKLNASDVKRDDIKRIIAAIDRPVLANQVLASTSAIFSWAIRNEVDGVQVNPCKLIDRHGVQSRERVLSDSELPLFWKEFDQAGPIGRVLKLILLTGQRPGEVRHMRLEHLSDGGWWEMPGSPVSDLGWPGTKNGEPHRLWLPKPARELIGDLGKGFALTDAHNRPFTETQLPAVMRRICERLGVNDKATPHDLRRTHGTRVTGLGFGRDAMNRIQNHREGGIASVYDRHAYSAENQNVMEAVAAGIMALVEGKATAKVVPLRKRQK